MQRHFRRLTAAIGVAAAVAVAAPAAVAAAGDDGPAVAGKGPAKSGLTAAEELARPAFKMPFRCNQTWVGSNWSGHSPAHSIDWNHYDADGNMDDLGRVVLASAPGTVSASYYSTGDGYGNTVVIDHGDGWQTRYAHLKTRAVSRGDRVGQGQKVGQVGATSATGDFTPHLHYEQIHGGSVVVSVVQGVTWGDFLKREQVSRNNCG
ncbi:M23 family metallopeptidase [Streptomyces sp. NPDC054784]